MQVEAWNDHRLYVWNLFAGRGGTNNDNTMDAMYLLFTDILSGKFELTSPIPYEITGNGRTRSLRYVLSDGIYPSWVIF